MIWTVLRRVEVCCFWLLLYRLVAFDGLCFLPRNPISWITATRHRGLKHYFAGPIYSVLSYAIDGDLSPMLLVLICLLSMIQGIGNSSKRTTKNEARRQSYISGSGWKWAVVLVAPVILAHRYYVLHEYREELHKRLDAVFPELDGVQHFRHDVKGDLRSLTPPQPAVSISGVFHEVDSWFQEMHAFEQRLVYSLSKTATNHYGSRLTVPIVDSFIYKTFEPKENIACRAELWRYIGVSKLSDTMKRMHEGKLAMDVYKPEVSAEDSNFKRSPVVLFVHGGGWRAGEKSVFQTNYAGGIPAFLLHNGFTVVAMSYRLHCSGVTGFEMLEDIEDAIQTIKDKAARGVWDWDVDADSIFLLGMSAGGHLSLLTGLRTTDASIKGVISLYGPTEAREPVLIEKTTSVYEKLLQPALLNGLNRLCNHLDTNDHLTMSKASCMTELSPVAKVHPGAPPILLIHGQKDPIVPISQAYWLSEALTKTNVTHALVDVPCASHDCDHLCSSPCSQAAMYAMERFFNSILQ